MSELSERARDRAKSKVNRLVRTDPKVRVDASNYRPPNDLNADVQTGPKPISRRQFKRGGKVHGEVARMHAGKRPRKAAGGVTTIDGGLINRDVKEAIKERGGINHVGGMRKGGRAHKFGGGPMMGRPEMPARPMIPGRPMPPRPEMRGMMRKAGGKVHTDAAEDKKLIHELGCKCGKCSGGRIGKKGGGPSVDDGALEGTRPKGDRLARKAGGRAKKGMNVNIIIAPAGGSGPKPPMPLPGAMPPPGGPVGLHQGVPPPPVMPPGAAPPMGPPPMGRKAGGRAYPIKSGGGGGLARLEKARAYGP